MESTLSDPQTRATRRLSRALSHRRCHPGTAPKGSQRWHGIRHHCSPARTDGYGRRSLCRYCWLPWRSSRSSGRATTQCDHGAEAQDLRHPDGLSRSGRGRALDEGRAGSLGHVPRPFPPRVRAPDRRPGHRISGDRKARNSATPRRRVQRRLF